MANVIALPLVVSGAVAAIRSSRHQWARCSGGREHGEAVSAGGVGETRVESHDRVERTVPGELEGGRQVDRVKGADAGGRQRLGRQQDRLAQWDQRHTAEQRRRRRELAVAQREPTQLDCEQAAR